MPADTLTLDLDPATLAAPRTLPCLVTPAPFRAWLTAQRPGEIVGRRRSSGLCPVARFLYDEGYADLLVDDGWLTLDMTRACRVVAMPLWARAFVRAIDVPGLHGQLMTAQEALAALGEGD